MNIVQVRFPNDCRRYNFMLPHGEKVEKGSYVCCETKNGRCAIAECVTDSEEVSENVVDMIMEGKNVTSKIVGVFKLDTF